MKAILRTQRPKASSEPPGLMQVLPRLLMGLGGLFVGLLLFYQGSTIEGETGLYFALGGFVVIGIALMLTLAVVGALLSPKR